MKTTGVSGIPKFGLLDFLGHPNTHALSKPYDDRTKAGSRLSFLLLLEMDPDAAVVGVATCFRRIYEGDLQKLQCKSRCPAKLKVLNAQETTQTLSKKKNKSKILRKQLRSIYPHFRLQNFGK